VGDARLELARPNAALREKFNKVQFPIFEFDCCLRAVKEGKDLLRENQSRAITKIIMAKDEQAYWYLLTSSCGKAPHIRFPGTSRKG
jgi:hypothetical protein